MSGIASEDIAKILYTTTSRRDYCPKPYIKCKQARCEQEFKDPIAAGFAKFLKIDEKVEPPCEDGDTYLEITKDKKGKKIQELYFKEPLDHLIIKEDTLLGNKTEYQVDYCHIESEVRKQLLENEKKKFSLPPDWITPETTQKIDFREPVLINKHALDPPLIIIAPNSLGKNEKINEILKVKTGASTYEDTIGKLGDFIVKNQMHGKINH